MLMIAKVHCSLATLFRLLGTQTAVWLLQNMLQLVDVPILQRLAKDIRGCIRDGKVSPSTASILLNHTNVHLGERHHLGLTG